jgi:hypothetical protein
MSHFTDNLYLHREIQRLLNENNQMKALLSEYRGPYDTGENIGGFDFRTPEEKAEQEEADKKRKEAAKQITTDELQRMMNDAGFTGTPEEYQKQIRKERFAIRQKAKDAAAAGARSAEDFQKAVENKSYKLNAFQEKMYAKYGTAYLEKLSRGLSKREASRLASGAKVTDQADLNRLKATKDVPFIGSRSDAEAILARRRRELDKYGGGPMPYENDYFSARDIGDRIRGAAGDRFRAAQDETTRRNREEALRTSTGQKVRDFNALVSGQQAQIKQFGQQMSGLRPEAQERIQAAMRRGLSPGQAAQEELNRRKQTDVVALQAAQRKEDEAKQRLANTEASYKNKYPGRDMSDQAVQGRIPPMSGGRVLSAAERRKQLETMSDEELNRQPR